jgi:hypothetical protein
MFPQLYIPICITYLYFRKRSGDCNNLTQHVQGYAVGSCTRERKKLSALLFFQFIYTKVGVEQVRHFST